MEDTVRVTKMIIGLGSAFTLFFLLIYSAFIGTSYSVPREAIYLLTILAGSMLGIDIFGER